MKTRHLACSVLALFLFASCTTLMNLLPEVSMEKRQVIYDMAEKMAFPEVRTLGRSKTRRMDLKSGQWITVLQETLNGDKNVSLTTTKVISVNSTTVTLEMEAYSAAADALPTYSQITFEGYPIQGNLSYAKEEFDGMMNSLRITRSRTRQGNGPVNEMPPELLAMAQGMTRSALAGSMVRLGEAKREAYESPYIQTASGFSHHYTVSLMGITTQGRSVTHSSIPVSGVIASEDNHTKATTVAYGYKGATSVF
ncbi:hypothetical protein [Desulfoluna sp.]|uniref:hypothetical protein n=1 Tax=Desulfoluna sp. TaxID=2045199 RepID=UPI00262463DD|nr:hypothetical protein [Desulfoluna sp.]